MKKLVDHLMDTASSAVFSEAAEDENALVREYYERSRRKLEDEKWLKENKAKIIEILQKHERDKMDFGNIRVSLIVPNTSHFDREKLADYLIEKGMGYLVVPKFEVNEEALTEAIERGEIDLEELKAHAWVESRGTPRLDVRLVK